MTTKIEFDNIEQWRSFRRQTIGGSDVGTILGFNKYCTPLQWLASRGTDTPENDAMHLGHLLEPVVATLFQENTGCEYEANCEKNIIYVNNQLPRFHATPDRLGVLNDEKFVLEIKTTSMHVDRSRIPETWYLQLQLYLTILERNTGYLAWLVGGRDFDYIKIERNPELCEKMVKNVLSFLDGDDREYTDMSDVLRTYPTAEERKEKELNAETYLLVNDYKQNATRIKLLEQENESIRCRLSSYLADCEFGTYQGERVLSFKNVKARQTLDTQRFKAAYPDLYQSFLRTGEPSRQLRFLNP